MNRIDKKFNELKHKKQKAFIAYITAGDPDLKFTEDLVLAFEVTGVDIVELGVPFSDPLADGATIQGASQRALQSGTTLLKIFDLVKRIRRSSQLPITLMLYYNQVFHFGEVAFIKQCKESGVDGFIIPDLPPESAKILRHAAKALNISTVFFIAPTTTKNRIKTNAQASTGFIYYVSLAGVTGTKQAIASEVINHIKSIKRLTTKPVCAGFGISSGEQAKEIARVADGVIVGSAIIQEIQKNLEKKDSVQRVTRFVTTLVKAVKPDFEMKKIGIK